MAAIFMLPSRRDAQFTEKADAFITIVPAGRFGVKLAILRAWYGRRRGRRDGWSGWWWCCHQRGRILSASDANSRCADRRPVWREKQFNATEVDGLARGQVSLPDGGAIDESPIGGTEILDEYIALIYKNLAMRPGNRRVVDFEVVGEAAAQEIWTRLEFDFPRRR
jgi:hypothetical protein